MKSRRSKSRPSRLERSRFERSRLETRLCSALLVCLLPGCGGTTPEAEGPEPARPSNLVVVCLDTVRYDTFWLPEDSGFEDALTPWLESGAWS